MSEDRARVIEPVMTRATKDIAALESENKRLREALEKARRELNLHEASLSAVYTYLQGQPEPIPQQLSTSVAEAIEACEKSCKEIDAALRGE